MASAYENIRKLNSLVHAGAPLTEQKRMELARLRRLIEFQLLEAERSQEPSSAAPDLHHPAPSDSRADAHPELVVP